MEKHTTFLHPYLTTHQYIDKRVAVDPKTPTLERLELCAVKDFALRKRRINGKTEAVFL